MGAQVVSLDQARTSRRLSQYDWDPDFLAAHKHMSEVVDECRRLGLRRSELSLVQLHSRENPELMPALFFRPGGSNVSIIVNRERAYVAPHWA